MLPVTVRPLPAADSSRQSTLFSRRPHAHARIRALSSEVSPRVIKPLLASHAPLPLLMTCFLLRCIFLRLQVEPNTKLFPAVFVRPSSPNLFQFELAKIKVGPLMLKMDRSTHFASSRSYFSGVQNAMPLSSAIFKSEHKNPVPQCPPRLDVQTINAVLWSRMPNTFLKVETARVSERHGWVVQCVEPLQMLAVHIPEENRCGGCGKQPR